MRTIADLLSAQLEREALPTRRVLERVPDGRVYLRLLDVAVPSIYGPSADDRVF